MLPTLTLLFAGLTAASPPAHAPLSDGARVLILPIVAPGVPPSDREDIEARIAAVLAESVPTATPAARTAARACATQLCLARTAVDHGITHWLRAEIDGGGDDREYHIRVSAGEIGDPTMLASSTSDCMICGMDDLAAALEARTTEVRADLTSDRGRSPRQRETMAPRALPLSQDGTLPRADASRRSGVLRPTGLALLAAGSASLVGGAVLLGIDGREIRQRCDNRSNLDDDGDCRFVHNTRGGGIAMLTGGILAAAGGITLVSIDRHRRRADVRARLGYNRIVIQGRF